jgi:sortase A
MVWRRVVGGVGRTLIAVGVLILLFVAYQLWGTGLAEARSQNSLRDSFLQSQGGSGRTTSTSSATGGTTTTTSTTFPDAPPPAPTGAAVAIIRIPKIGVDKAVVQGVNLSDLKKGPGHYPTTPMPGQPGNAAIAGHRTTYGAPFYNLNDVGKDDKIFVTTAQGAFEYRVRETKVVRPTEVSVLDPTTDNRLTLTTCNPRFSARERLVLVADLMGPAAPAPPPSATPPDPGGGGSSAPPAGPTAFEGEAGLSGGASAKRPAVLWGLLAALVWLVTWAVGRRWRRWPAYLVGTPVFLLVLFVFFENFSRLLPANF